jgi:hypothetical protein
VLTLNGPRHGAVACLPVDDVQTAVAYYERYLGFQVAGRAGDGSLVAVARDGATVLLRRSMPSDPARPPGERESRAWDAIIPLIDFDSTYDDLSVRGASLHTSVLEHPLLGRTFTVEDRSGNLLCFTPAPADPWTSLRRRARSARTRLHAAQFTRSCVAELRPHRDEFGAFYERLANKRDIFYMFFTGGLLHWALKAASYVPDDVNLVLIASDLSPDEITWIRTNVSRPFHHVRLSVNDWPVWDFLLTTNRMNFGWLDIDCLVLNDEIFSQITQVPADAAVNCAWSYESGFGFRIANTYLVFVNASAIATLRARGIPVWARPHDWRGGDRSDNASRRCFYRIPSARERRLMLTVAPPDANARPQAPGSRTFFDTLAVYQILAHAVGFRTGEVRRLENPMLGPVAPGALPAPAPQEMSDELIHVGGISYYNEHFHNPNARTRYLAADYLTLRDLAPRLPDLYRDRLAVVAAELRSFGVEPDDASDAVREYLLGVGGISESAAAKALANPTW